MYMQEHKEKDRGPHRINVIFVCAAAAAYSLTGLFRFVPIGVFFLAFAWAGREETSGQAKKRLDFRCFLIPLLLSAPLFLFAPFITRSHMLWRYPFQKAFHDIYTDSPEWIPAFSADVQSDYEFDVLPSVMQGIGHYSVRFVTTPERAAEYLEQFSAQAVCTVPYPENPSWEIQVPGNPDKPADLHLDAQFWQNGHSDGAAVCLLRYRCSDNHPASSAVIINSRTGAVQFTRYG